MLQVGGILHLARVATQVRDGIPSSFIDLKASM